MNKKGRHYSNEMVDAVVIGTAFVFGTFLLALCYNLFFVPNNFVVGGMSGLAIVLNNLTGLNAQLFIYASSIILMAMAYIFLGVHEFKKICIGSLLYPLFVTFTAPVAKVLLYFLSFQEILVTVILESLLYGVSNGIIYKYGYSTGGSDVIVKLLCKWLHVSEGKAILSFNIIIILAGAFVFGVNTAVYATIILVISSILVDKISIGISNSKKFMIYTREVKKIKALIADDFHAGFTIFPTIGGHSHIHGSMIMCVIRNRDVNWFKSRILEIDETAFFVVSDCYEVQGGVKRSNLPFI